jgi:hypothetical protein
VQRHTPIITVPHRHAWLWEPLAERSTFALRAMFGAQAVYLDGKLIACFCTKREPWRGVLFATGREHHASLCADFPELKPHQILGKWLYLAEASSAFEAVAPRVLRLALAGDPRLGVVPNPKRARKSRRLAGRAPGGPAR